MANTSSEREILEFIARLGKHKNAYNLFTIDGGYQLANILQQKFNGIVVYDLNKDKFYMGIKYKDGTCFCCNITGRIETNGCEGLVDWDKWMMNHPIKAMKIARRCEYAIEGYHSTC
jgi:hypothetical protein